MGTQKNRLNETLFRAPKKYSQFCAQKFCSPMYYVEYGKNGSKLIFSEKDGHLSQFPGSYDFDLPFKSDKVSPDRKLKAKTFTCQWLLSSRVKRKLRG